MMVFIPKFRRKSLFGLLRNEFGAVFHELVRQKECFIKKGHLMPNHAHMLTSIPQKRKVSEVIGIIKDKSAMCIASRL